MQVVSRSILNHTLSICITICHTLSKLLFHGFHSPTLTLPYAMPDAMTRSSTMMSRGWEEIIPNLGSGTMQVVNLTQTTYEPFHLMRKLIIISKLESINPHYSASEPAV